MKSFDDIYNDAVDYSVEVAVPADVAVGVAKLSHVLRVFDAMMSGGLGFAVEVIEPEELQNAIEGLRYFDLIDVANLLSSLVESSQGGPDYDQKETLLDGMINEGDLVLDAFRTKTAVVPSDFGA